MSIRYIELTDLNDNVLYPRTHWNAIVDKPNVATIEQLAQKQDILTSANAGTNVTITSEGGVIKINATGTGGATSYNDLTDKPSINGTTLQGALSLAELGINIPTAVSQLTNDAHYVNEDQLDTKQDVLSSANAGANISITFVDGVPKINAIGGSGTGDYNNLTNRPTLNGATIAGAYTLGTGLTIANKVISVTGLPTIAITASGGYMSTVTLNGTTYNAPPVVSANPSGTITRTLTSLRINGVDYNINPAVAGVTAIGGATGAITLGSHLAVSGQQLRVTDMPSISITTDNTTHLVNTITLNNTTYNVLSSVTTGVTSFGQQSGDITISNDFTMSGKTLQLARGIPTIVINPSGIQPSGTMSTFTLNGTTYGLQANTIHGASVGGEVYFNTNHFSLSNNSMSLNNNVLVTANGSEDATATLTKIKVGGTTYGIAPGTTIDGHSGALTLNAAHLAISQAGEISVTNLPPTYSAGDGISLSNNEISITYDSSHLAVSDHNQLQVTNLPPVVTANPATASTDPLITDIQIGSSKYRIKDTTYTASTGIAINSGNAISNTGVLSLDTKTGAIAIGNNLTWSGSDQAGWTLNATDTTYSAGTGIAISNTNQISNTGILKIGNTNGEILLDSNLSIVHDDHTGTNTLSINSIITDIEDYSGSIMLGNYLTLDTTLGVLDVTGIPIVNVGGTPQKATSIKVGNTTYTIAYSPVVSRAAPSSGDTITSIKIDNNTYSIIDSRANIVPVIANPGSATYNLSDITIGSNTYRITSLGNTYGNIALDSNLEITTEAGVNTLKVKKLITEIGGYSNGAVDLGDYLTIIDGELNVTGLTPVSRVASPGDVTELNGIKIGNTTYKITNTTYSAGDGLTLTGTSFSVNTGTGLSIGAQGELDNDGVLSLTQNTTTIKGNITLGDKLTISNQTINAIDTTYSAGTGININNSNQIINTGVTKLGTKTGDILLDNNLEIVEEHGGVNRLSVKKLITDVDGYSGSVTLGNYLDINDTTGILSITGLVPVSRVEAPAVTSTELNGIKIGTTTYKITNTTYSSGTGIAISNSNEISNTGVLGVKKGTGTAVTGTIILGENLTLSDHTIAATDTTYTGSDTINISQANSISVNYGSGLTSGSRGELINDGVISVTKDSSTIKGAITLGSNLSINGQTINSKDTITKINGSTGDITLKTVNGTAITGSGDITIPVVDADPETGTSDIRQITIDNNTYNLVDHRANIVPVIANATGAVTGDLTAISINGLLYDLNFVKTFGGESGAITIDPANLTMTGKKLSVTNLPPVVSRAGGSTASKLSSITIGGSTYTIEDSTSSKVASIDERSGRFSLGTYLTLSEDPSTGADWKLDVTGLTPVERIASPATTSTELNGIKIGATTYKITNTTYSQGEGITITGTTISNAGVLGVKKGTAAAVTGTIILGNNLSISDHTISAIDTITKVNGSTGDITLKTINSTALTGSGNIAIPVVSAGGTPASGATTINTITIGGTVYKIQDNNTTYSNGSGLSLTNTTFSVNVGMGLAIGEQGVLDNDGILSIKKDSTTIKGNITLGANLSISGQTISATDTVTTINNGSGGFTLGSYLALGDQNVINVTGLTPVERVASPASGSTELYGIKIGATTYKITNTTYSQGTGITISGTTISNAGVTKLGTSTGEISLGTYLDIANNTLNVRDVVFSLGGKTGTIAIGNNLSWSGSASTGWTLNATDTTYSQGTGITISNNTITNDGVLTIKKGSTSIKGEITLGNNLSLNGQTINATDTTYSGSDTINIGSGNSISVNYGTGLTGGSRGELVNDGVLSVAKGTTTIKGAITLGNNLSISGQTINATDTTYSQGTGITINANNQISANTATASANGIGRVAADSTAANMSVSYSGGVATIKGKYKMSLSDTILTIEELF